MAFTDTDIRKAEHALSTGAKSEDLFRLGLIYSTDIENRGPDFVEAHKWFNLAAMMGSSPAKAYREEIRREMSPHDVSLALKAARSWMKENSRLIKRQSTFA